MFSGNSSSIANTNSASQNQNIADEALELAIGSHNPAAGFSLDLLPTAQPTQSFLLDNHQFLNDAASAVMQNTARLPTNFPMNILDFQQQLAGSQQQSQQMVPINGTFVIFSIFSPIFNNSHKPNPIWLKHCINRIHQTIQCSTIKEPKFY